MQQVAAQHLTVMGTALQASAHALRTTIVPSLQQLAAR